MSAKAGCSARAAGPGGRRVSVSQPVGGILFPGPLRGSRSVTIHLCGLPVGASVSRGSPRRTSRPNPLLGLAPGGGYPAAEIAPDAGALLPHRFTLACARTPRGPGHRRSALCCPLPSDRSDLALASTLLCGVPTFLDTTRGVVPRSPDRLTDLHSVASGGADRQRTDSTGAPNDAPRAALRVDASARNAQDRGGDPWDVGV